MLLAGSLVDLTSNDVPTRVINLTNDFISAEKEDRHRVMWIRSARQVFKTSKQRNNDENV